MGEGAGASVLTVSVPSLWYCQKMAGARNRATVENDITKKVAADAEADNRGYLDTMPLERRDKLPM